MAVYLCQAQQKWAVAPVANGGGYPGSRTSSSRSLAQTALAAAGDAELVVTVVTGAPEQLWRMDRLADGTWRIMPKSAALALSAVGSSSATLSKWDPKSEKQHRLLKTP